MKKILQTLTTPILLSITLFSLTGCSMTQSIVMEYNTKTPRESNTGKICINKFTDSRDLKTRIGLWQSTIGNEFDIISDQHLNFVIGSAISDELKQLGYNIYLIDIDSNKTDEMYNQCSVLNGDVKKVFVEGVPRFAAYKYTSIITVEIKFITQKGLKYEKKYSSNGDGVSISITGASKPTLDEALEKIILEITQDIKKLQNG